MSTSDQQTEPLPPRGVVTLLFTDIVGSSELAAQHGAAFEAPRATHFRLLREAAQSHDGFEVSTAGDALFLAFERASDAVQAATDAQLALATYTWPEDIGPVRVRMGMHTGEPILAMNNDRWDYFGPPVNLAARVSSAAHGGQILLSEQTRTLLDEVTLKLLGNHRLKGVGEATLYQVLAPGLLEEFPPPATLRPDRHNLPLPVTPYLGREREVEELRGLLTGGKVRLLTLTGFGGMGKTRTAIHVAELVAEEFPGGVWWMELAEVRTGEAMLHRIALSLGLHPTTGEAERTTAPRASAREQVTEFLRSHGKTLLVLDNLEQVEAAGAVVRDLLASSPNLVCFATSRRSLELNTEQVRELPPLEVSEAIHLFTERARAVQADFVVTPDNEADVRKLVRQLDGIPLTIELAAARIQTLTPRQMLPRLSERFRLLQTRRPDLPERQRALRAAIDWSHDLLTDDEKSLFAQLSVFAGRKAGFTLDDVEAVCDPDSVFDPLESLHGLRHHSLLMATTDLTTQERRFSLLEALREYAAEKLAEQPELSRSVKEKHARYYLARGDRERLRLRTHEESSALAQLEILQDDLRLARHFAAATSGLESLHSRLSLLIGTFRVKRGFPREAVEAVEAGLSAARQGAESGILQSLLLLRGMIHADLKENEEAKQCAEEARSLTQDRGTEADAENLLGEIALVQKNYADARTHYTRSLTLRETLRNPILLAISYNNLGLVETDDPNGNQEQAQAYFLEALRLRREVGDTAGIGLVLNNLGNIAFARSDYQEAERLFGEAATIERDLHNTKRFGITLQNLGEAIESQGRITDAIYFYLAAEHLFRESESDYLPYSAEYVANASQTLGWNEIRLANCRRALTEQSLTDVHAWCLEPPRA